MEQQTREPLYDMNKQPAETDFYKDCEGTPSVSNVHFIEVLTPDNSPTELRSYTQTDSKPNPLSNDTFKARYSRITEGELRQITTRARQSETAVVRQFPAWVQSCRTGQTLDETVLVTRKPE